MIEQRQECLHTGDEGALVRGEKLKVCSLQAYQINWLVDCAKDTLAERSKAVAQGAIPKGCGFEPHRCHFDLLQCKVALFHVSDASVPSSIQIHCRRLW